MSNIQALADTLHKLAKPDMKPKELMASVRKKHPDASKKQIVRAAFFSLIQDANSNSEKSKRLHAFALSERVGDEEDATPPKRPRKERRKEREPRSHRGAR